MDALWRLYSAGALKDRRPQTQDAYAGVWRRLEPRIGNADVASITTEQLQALHGAIPPAPASTPLTGRWR